MGHARRDCLQHPLVQAGTSTMQCRSRSNPTPALTPPAHVPTPQAIGSCDCPEYIARAERRLAEEGERCRHYLDASTEPKITRVLETELVANNMRVRAWPQAARAVLFCLPGFHRSLLAAISCSNQRCFIAADQQGA